ncbi:MAG: hypothetical protein IJM74_08880 [Bacteroidales bacterium]|nr:hypothetical protein [Bacteroidales bacterium]
MDVSVGLILKANAAQRTLLSGNCDGVSAGQVAVVAAPGVPSQNSAFSAASPQSPSSFATLPPFGKSIIRRSMPARLRRA